MDYHKFFKNKNILITGGLGFIGSNLAKSLLKYEPKIFLLDSLIPDYGGNLFNIREFKNQVNLNISDIRDIHSLRYLVQDIDYIFNLAGQTSHLDSMEDPYTDLDINCRSQLSLLETCRKYNTKAKIVFASTRQIYGKPQYLPVDEKHLLKPVDVNGINKMAGEWYHILYNNVYGIKTSSLRLTNTYGPGMRIKDARQTFLGIWIKEIIRSENFEVWGGKQKRDFNYIDDVVDALLKAAISKEADGQVFNLGNQEVKSLEETAKLLIEENKGGSYQIKEFPKERKKIDIGDYYSDYTLIRNCLNWEPKTDLKSGLSKTLDYYKEFIEYYL